MILSASLFTFTDGPEFLLLRVEALACHSPVILVLISDEEPNQITLLKNPRQYASSLANASPVDNLMYGFMGMDTRNLAAVHLPSSAFKISTQYNVLDDPAAIQMDLDGLPQDQSFHPYVLVTMPGMMNSTC